MPIPAVKPSGIPTIIPGKAPRGLAYCFPFADPTFREINRGLKVAAKGSTQTFGHCVAGQGMTLTAATTAWITYALTSDYSQTSPFSQETILWLTATGFTADGSDVTNIVNNTAGASVTSWLHGIDASSSTGLQGQGNNAGWGTTAFTCAANEYIHFVLTWDGATATLYANGASVGTASVSSFSGTAAAIAFGGVGGDKSVASTYLFASTANVCWTPQEVFERYQDPYSFLSFPQDKIASIIQMGLAHPAGGGTSTTGTLSETLANSTSLATVTHADHGTLSETLSGLAGAALGGPVVTATLSKTLGTLAFSGTGTIPAKNTLAKTLATLTGSSSGVVPDHGTLSATLATITPSITGHIPPLGRVATLSSTLGTMTGSSSLASSDKGTLSSTLGTLSNTVTGASTDKATTSKTLAALTGSINGTVVSSGPARVAAQSGVGQAGNGSTPITSYTYTLPEAITPGNACFFTLAGFGSQWPSDPTLVDNNGRSYVLSQNNYSSTVGGNVASFYGLNVQGSPTSVTVSLPSSAYVSLSVDTFSGLATAIGDGVAATWNEQDAPGAGTTSTNSFTPGRAGEFIWAFSLDATSQGGTSVGSGFSAGLAVADTWYSEYGTVTSASSQVASFTQSTGAGDYLSTAIVVPTLAQEGAIVDASLSKTLASATLSGTADFKASLTGSNTLGALAFSGTGIFAAHGTLNDTLGNLGASVTGTVGSHIAVSTPLADSTVVATGVDSDKSTLSKTLGALVVSATGQFEVARHATASVTLAALSKSITGHALDHASAAKTLQALSSTTTVHVTGHGSLSGTLGSLTTTRTRAEFVDTFHASETLASLSLVSTAHNDVKTHGTVSETLGALKVSYSNVKTKFTTVNPRTHLTVLGYQPGTPPIQQFPVG